MLKDFISIHDLIPYEDEFHHILELTQEMKKHPHRFKNKLKKKILAMIFQKPSLRTRITFELGMQQLGGKAIYLAPSDIQLGTRESVYDVGKNLELWFDGIMIFTLNEKRGHLVDLKLAYVGDGNNVCHSLLFAAAKAGTKMSVATPPGYEPNAEIIKQAKEDGKETNFSLELTHDPHQAVLEADAVYTDVWTSMGQEKEREMRAKIFAPFQVNQALMAKAKGDALFMHCLPAHRGEEVTDEVLDSSSSIVYDQARNRLHIQKVIMLLLMGKKERSE
jgi:ornithine carbamoyltransferase